MANERTRQPDEGKEGLRRRSEDGKANLQNNAEPVQHPLLRMQRQLGNAHVSRMLGQHRAEAPHPSTLQRQTPEEDEEGMAQAMRDPSLQRQTPEEDEEGTIQTMPEVGAEGGPVSSALASRIQDKRGGGSTLDSGIRGTMETALGTSFDNVRIHSDGESHAINRQINAKAFTTGNDIFLGKGASASDSKLLAHELTHVVQQRSIDTSGPMTVTPSNDQYEKEADAVAESATQPAGGNTGQRQANEETQET